MLTCKGKIVEGSRLIPLVDSPENICTVNIYLVSIQQENKSILIQIFILTKMKTKLIRSLVCFIKSPQRGILNTAVYKPHLLCI